MNNSITLERNGPEVITARFTGIASGWEKWVMLSSDHHFDNIHCDRALLKRHLDKAVERDAMIYVFGDIYCAMQGKYDKRSDRTELRPEYAHTNKYLDALVETAGEFYGPYADRIAMLSEGNHETGILDRHGVSLLSNLAHVLNKQGGAVQVGPYSGWARLLFKSNGSRRQSIRIAYHHGAGGGGPVTRGVIQTNRQAVYLPDADIVVNGHTHDGWIVPIARERISDLGKLRRDLCWFVRTPSYKNEYGKGGWADRTWKPPKPMGCVWLRLWFHNDWVHSELIADMQ